MFKRFIAVTLLLCAAVAVTADDNVCPCIPVTKVWVATSCETWNCAQAAMVMANGDPYVITIPTNDTKYGWVILRRVVAGSATTVPPDPFQITSYASLQEAVGQYTAADPNKLPMMAMAVDGTALVLQLREPVPASRRRAAGR